MCNFDEWIFYRVILRRFRLYTHLNLFINSCIWFNLISEILRRLINNTFLPLWISLYIRLYQSNILGILFQTFEKDRKNVNVAALRIKWTEKLENRKIWTLKSVNFNSSFDFLNFRNYRGTQILKWVWKLNYFW